MTDGFEKCFDLSSGIIYFPVRHHSPACACHIAAVMEQYKPDCVLIEGPSDGDFLIKYLADEGTVPPVCIYSIYDDRLGKISEDKEKYRAYYPFLAYSPELCAIKEAAKRGIAAHFIDMPYAAQLAEFGAEESRRRFGHDETAEYYTLTAKKSGCRSFSEFWERGFEMSYQKDSREFVRSVYMLGRYMRELSPPDDKNSCRESCMRGNIRKYMQEYSRIMVVAGAYHIHGLGLETGDIKTAAYSKADSALYIMPYTFAETDSRSGYGAGVLFPAFYSEVWKKLTSGVEQPYLKTVEDFIVSAARYSRTKQPVSIPDETEALYIANSLAALRGKPQSGAYELLDGVRSAFVKGDINTAAAFELDYLLRRMTGLGAGEINISDDERIIPPCVSDFRVLCKKYRLNIGTIAQQSTTLDIVKNHAHYEKSCFLHRMKYLGTSFCRRESGPDYSGGTDEALIREVWSYRYSTSVETQLIDLSVYGGSIETICRSKLREECEKLQTASDAGRLLLDMFTTGFSENVPDTIYDIVRDDMDFTSQCRFMACINKLFALQKHTLGGAVSAAEELMTISFGAALCRIPEICMATGDECGAICSGIRLMYSLSAEYPTLCDRGAFLREISLAADNSRSSPMIYGVCLAICSRAALVSEEDYGGNICAFMLSAAGEDSADFLAGIISAGRDIIFTSRTVLESVDSAVRRMDQDKFTAVLPKLRGAFTAFLPTETERISRSIAELYGTSEDSFSGSVVFSAEEVAAAAQIDRRAEEIMKKWGIL